MFQLRVRLVNDNGTTDANSRVLKSEKITYTGIHAGVAALKFSVSRDVWQPTQFPFVVQVEYSTGGEFNPLPENDLFIVEKDSDDSKDSGKIVNYDAVAYVPWILAGTYVGDGPWNEDGERTIDGGAANAGRILDYFFTESTGRGPWLKHLVWNFNGSRDSANKSWVTADKEEFAWRMDGIFYNKVLDKLAEHALCEWSTKGTELLLFRHNTHGVDRSSSVLLGGPRFTRVPVKTDMDGWYTHIVSQFDKGRTWNTNAAAETRFGRRSIAVSHTGVKTAAAAQRLSAKILDRGLEVAREESYQWEPLEVDYVPWRDFALGDLVTGKSRGGTNVRRVVAIVVTQTAQNVRVDARVGERISTLAARNQKKLESVTGGAVSGGTGGTFPTAPNPEKAAPAKPLGLHVVSNVATFTPVGPRAAVKIAWAPVTEATDGALVTVTEYGVWENDAEVMRVTNPEAEFEIPSRLEYEYRVVAYVGANRVSDMSDPVKVTAATPALVTAIPSKPSLVSSHGNVRATWDGTFETSGVEPDAHTIRVEARVGTTGGFTRQGSFLDRAGEHLVSLGEVGQSVQVRFIAYDALGRLTGTSAVETITVAGVGLSDLNEEVNDYLSDIESMALEAQQSADGGNKIHYGNTAPAGTDHKVGDTWFDGANGNRINEWNGSAWVLAELGSNAIANLAITNAKIANLDAAKITTGELDANRIGARSLATEKLLVGDLTNLWGNQFFKVDGPIVGVRYSGTEVAPAGNAVLISQRDHHNSATAFEVQAGDEFLVSTTAKRIAGTLELRGGLWRHDFTGGSGWSQLGDFTLVEELDDGWGRYQRVVPIIEGTRTCSLYFQLNQYSPYDTQWLVSDVVIRRRLVGELIVDGSIKSHLMDAEEIYANQAHMEILSSGIAQFDEITGLGNKLTISANESVEFIVGRQNTMDDQLSDMQSTLDDTADAAGQALSEADAARTAALAAGADLVAQGNEIDLIKQNVADHQAVFRLSDTGAQIAFSDNSASLDMTPQSITFVSDNTEVAAITDESIIIYRGVFETAQVGNHLMQKRGSTRTIFTPIEGS